jgi:hypothetical protein
MNNTQSWGLPPEFVPVRYALSDATKNALRGLMQPNEPVVVSIANEGDTVSLVATPERLFAVKTAQMGAGASGVSVKEFPWEGVFNLVMTPMSFNLKIAVHFRSNDGRKVEVGRRALLAKPAVENLMPFELAAGEEAFNALMQLWNNKRTTNENLV